MATTIRSTAVRADGSPIAGVNVHVYPVLPGSPHPNRPHYPAVEPGSETELLLGGVAVTDEAGEWEMDVTPTMALEPEGQVAYRVVQTPPGEPTGPGSFDRIVIVPDTDQPLWVAELEPLDPHGGTDLSALDTHAARTTNVHGITDVAELETKTGAQVRADTARIAATNASKAYTDEEIAALVAAEGWELADPIVWEATTEYPPRTVVEASDGGYYVARTTTTGDDPTTGGPWLPLPTAIDTEHRGRDARDVHGIAAFVARLALEPTPIRDVNVFDEGATDPRPLDAWGGYLYGHLGDTLHRSDDDGDTWEEVATASTSGNLRRLLPTSDGEVLAVSSGQIAKSSGWADAPGTAPTWTVVLENTPGATFLQWGVDGDGDKFIAVHYATPSGDGWAASRYGWVSLDAGDTWAQVYDTVDLHGSEINPDTHIHAACYDPWTDRFFVCEGHEGPAGVYWSRADDLETWTRVPWAFTDSWPNGPTTACATDHGIVFGSDTSTANGLYVLRRHDDPDREALEHAWAWRDRNATTAELLLGYAEMAYRDPRTGIVYTCFRSNHANIAAVIAGSDGRVAAEVWREDDDDRGGRPRRIIVADTGRVAVWDAEKDRHLYARTGAPGVQSGHRLDTGRVLGGTVTTTEEGSLAVGSRALNDGFRSVAIGAAHATDSDAVAIGHNAEADISGTAVGRGAEAGTAGTAVGRDADAGNGATALGYQSKAGHATAVAVGRAAEAITDTGVANIDSTAVGRFARARANGATAIGRSALAEVESVAIGHDAEEQGRGVAIGHESYATGGVSVGRRSTSSHETSMALGRNARARRDDDSATPRSTAVGYGARANGPQDATAVGDSAEAQSNRTLALGTSSVANGNDTVAVGHGASTSLLEAIAVGRSASAGAQGAVAIGRSATASGTDSIALGKGTEVTASNTAGIGPRSLELEERSTPGGPPSGRARLALRDNGGTPELVVVFAGSIVKVVADGS